VEGLETRALLAVRSETFVAPNLSTLIAEALNGKNTAPAVINTMVSALETQLTNGPLADLKAGNVSNDEFNTEVSELVSSFDSNVDAQLLPRFKNVDAIIKLQGTKVETDLASQTAQQTAGLTTAPQLLTNATTAVNALTGGPLFPLHTPASAFVSVTQAFETNLNTITASLATNATTPLTLTQAQTVSKAEAEAYRAAMQSSLYLHPTVFQQISSAVDTFESSVAAITTTGSTSTQAQFQAAVTALDNTLASIAIGTIKLSSS
jgi:hypothetical protein